MTTTLATTGQIVVSMAAAWEYARARGLEGAEEARRELTALLVESRRTGTQPQSGAEGWRRRSRTHGVDVTAHVTRDGPLAIVVHVGVRDYRPRRRLGD